MSETAATLDSLLATKLYIPALRPNRVPRPRLTARLEAGAVGPLTLISAPAGFGKSTLLSEWIHCGGRPVAWVSLDEGDNDPIRFLGYLVTALQKLRPGLGEDALTAIRHTQSPTRRTLEPILNRLLNEIHALDEDLVLVLDDVHVLDDPEVHHILQLLLDRLPPRMHVVLATRVDPPLHLSRLRARGQLTEIRARDLRFTSQEAADFLNQAMRLSLSTADVEALEERTEGWAVGLQMAALSLQGRRDAEAFIAQFTGSHRFVLDYLTDEVLSRQPEPVREFLLRTSILARLSAPLCDAVLDGYGEGRDSQSILETLDGANLFLIPLDDTRTWYRYHHLFGTLLRHQLERKLATPEIAALHLRASDWYADHGHPEDALEHALAAGALDRATELISAHAMPRLMAADAGTVIRWIRALPLEWLDRRPELRLTYAWALVAQLELKEAESQVRTAERALGEAPGRELEAHLLTLRGLLTRSAGQTREAIDLYQQAFARLEEDGHLLRGLLSLELGTAYLTTDDPAEAERAFAEARAASERAGNTFGVLGAEWHLAEIQIARSRLREAADLARRSLRWAEEHGGRNSPGAAMAHGILAEIQREHDDLPAAVELAGRAWELGKRGEIANGLLVGSLYMARVLQSLEDFPGALAALDRAEEIMQRTGQPVWIALIHLLRAGIQLAQSRIEGNPAALEAATRWARDFGLLSGWRDGFEEKLPGLHRREFPYLIVARILVAQGEAGTALELLAGALERAERMGRVRSVIEILTLEALIRDSRGERDIALAGLRRALALAEPEGFVRIFVDEGPGLGRLIRQVAPGAVSPAYARRLAEAFGEETPPEPAAPPRAPSQDLPEPLSEREVEVLRLIATGLSNADAGRKLFIAPSTVKKHLENIYAKLGTRNRTQAIARAREAGLL
ncbi:MAG TPA: LuxR C-terminal-related transcriptional regulator [Thermoanaerobaculia bacterium]|jgi:LuxR family maltose regulon positive regulatory protein